MTSQRPTGAHRPLPQGKAALRYHGLSALHQIDRRQALPAGLVFSPTVAEINIHLKNQTHPPDASGQTSGLSWVRKFADPGGRLFSNMAGGQGTKICVPGPRGMPADS